MIDESMKACTLHPIDVVVVRVVWRNGQGNGRYLGGITFTGTKVLCRPCEV